MQKKYTYNQVDIAKKFRRIDGDKILTNEAKNIDKQTKEILNNPSEKIPKINLCLKFKKLNATNKLIQDKLNQAIKEEKKFPNDLVYKLLVNEPTFKQELIYKKLCNFKKISVENKKQNESFEEDESIYNNFCLSAYNLKNCKFLEKCNKKFDSDVKIMRHISSYTKFNDKKKLLNRNESFDNYKYNYLDLRKTIGEYKKYEYQEIMERFNKKNEEKEVEKEKAKRNHTINNKYLSGKNLYELSSDITPRKKKSCNKKGKYVKFQIQEISQEEQHENRTPNSDTTNYSKIFEDLLKKSPKKKKVAKKHLIHLTIPNKLKRKLIYYH